jgi:hypothetical protein
MAMRSAIAPAVLLTLATLATPAAADTFGGFSGVDRLYLVNRDKVCAPLTVKDGAASGSPQCETATADVVAKLSMKEPISQKGVKGSFSATASGRALTVSKKTGEAIVTWNAPDAITKVIDVFASQYEDRVAVTYNVRRLGKEVTDVVAFELIKTTGRTNPLPDPNAKPTTPDPNAKPTTPATPTTPAPPADPKLTKAVEAARKAPKAKAVAAWKGVLAFDADHSEARYRIAAAHAAAKKTADALTTLDELAKSSRADAIEWLVEARFDKVFAAMRADARYRAAVGLDRPPSTPYERLMGMGGQWEQLPTDCDKPHVILGIARDRSFKVTVKGSCRGDAFSVTKKGSWRISDDGIVLTIPTKGKATTAKDEAPCVFEKDRDEDALHCVLDRDIEFTVLPTRR